MLHNLKKFFDFILTRPFFLYLILIILVLPFLNRGLFFKNTIDQTMNRSGADVNFFKDLALVGPPYSEYKLQQCISYHQKVAKFYSFQRSEALAMMGYCYDLKGDMKRARNAYNESVVVNPNYFWPFYNLGLLSFKSEDYPKAVEYFKQALERDVKANIFLLSQSKVYNDIILSDPGRKEYNFLISLKAGRKDAYIFLSESLIRLKRSNEAFNVALLALSEDLDKKENFLYYAARASLQLKQFDKTIEFLKRALELDEYHQEALFYLGSSMHELNKKDIAQELFKRAKALHMLGISSLEKQLSQHKPRFF